MSKNYLITGGTSGIGEAIVRKIISDPISDVGELIVTYGHDDDAALALKGSLSSFEQKKLRLIKVDLSSRENLDEFVAEIKGSTLNLAGVVLNVGIGTYKPFFDYCYEDWDRVIETNLTIPVFMIQKMIREGLLHGSSVVLMGSLSGSIPYSSSVAYGISKAGLLFAAKTLVKELERFESRINAIAPGFIETRWQDGRSDESRSRINQKIALHRFGNPSEVADAVHSVMMNPYINGSILNVDGGYNYF